MKFFCKIKKKYDFIVKANFSKQDNKFMFQYFL